MITVEKLEKGTYFDDAFKISFRYDPTTVAKVKELAERRYLPEDRAWEIPAHELPALIEKVGLSNIKSEEAVVQALNTKEIEDKREATQERLKGIKPVRDFDFKTAPLPHQIEAFNYGMEKNSLLIGDEQGLGKTKIMVSKGGVPKGRIIPVYLTDEGDVYPIYLHEMGELEIIQRLVAGILDNKIVVDTNTRINSENDKISIFDLSKKK